MKVIDNVELGLKHKPIGVVSCRTIDSYDKKAVESLAYSIYTRHH